MMMLMNIPSDISVPTKLAGNILSNNLTNINGNPVTPDPLKLTRLLQLCSANLPVGGFSFSQGLEYAIETKWIANFESTQNWIALNLTQAIARTDLPILQRLYQAVETQDSVGFAYWNNHLIACRESKELRLAELAMGKALLRLLGNLDALDMAAYDEFIAEQALSFVAAFALAAMLWKIDLPSCLSGFCWTVIDNQVAAATKLVPLGQSQAQNLLFTLSQEVTLAMATASALADDEIGASLPRLAMASAWHETQYTRLFRS
jgi:urease accessory protein